MEYAEENLGQILPQRPLTPEETRDLLEPALDALAFIHGKGLVHGRLKPSNVMAAQDQLKLSSDSLMKVGEPVAGSARASAYDAPEIATGKISPASDSWSLGVTLMEALTQRLPAREIGMGEPMPETVPAPFMGIAHCCLRRDPERRCSAADIAARLRSNASSPLSMAQGPSTLRIPAAAGKWRYILPVAVVVLVAAAILFGPKLVNSHPETQPASVSSENSATPSAQTSSGRSNAPAKLEAAPSATATKPSARKSGNTNLANANRSNVSASSGATRPAAPPPASSAAAPTEAPATISGQVVQQPMPAVSKSARDTIHGTIKVRVKVAVDAAGNVQNATFVTAGPSKYFARQAMEAAQQWKFVPAQGQDPRTWIVQFGFKRSGTDAALESAKP
jgi:TonB family protein